MTTTSTITERKMRTIIESENEILKHYQVFFKKLERNTSSTESDLNDFVELYKNHLANFQIRARYYANVFFHQHEKQYGLLENSEAWQTAQEIKVIAEENVLKYLKIAKEALDRDYEEIISKIPEKPDES